MESSGQVTARDRFLKAVEEQLGKLVVWAAKAPDAFDCSELVAWGLNVASDGKLEHSATHTAQRYHDETRPLVDGEEPLPGDLCFYGADAKSVIHVTVCDKYGGVVSADGATRSITSLKVALANPANRVRRHGKRRYRGEAYFVVHRNLFVDELDRVSR